MTNAQVPFKGPNGETYFQSPVYAYYHPPSIPYWHAIHPYPYGPYYAPHGPSGSRQPQSSQQPKAPAVRSKKSLRRLFDKFKIAEPPPELPKPLASTSPASQPNTTFHVNHPVEICDVTPRSSTGIVSYYTAGPAEQPRPDSPLLNPSDHSEPTQYPGSSDSDGSYPASSLHSSVPNRNGSVSTTATSVSSGPERQRYPTVWHAPRPRHQNNASTATTASFEHPRTPPIPQRSLKRSQRPFSKPLPPPPLFCRPFLDTSKREVALLKNVDKRKSQRLILTPTSRYPTGHEAELYMPESVDPPRKEGKEHAGVISSAFADDLVPGSLRREKSTRSLLRRKGSSGGSLRRTKSCKNLKDAIRVVRPKSPPPLPKSGWLP